MNIIELSANLGALWLFLFFLFLFIATIWFFAFRKKIPGIRDLEKSIVELDKASKNIADKPEKSEEVKTFLEKLSRRSLIHKIVQEWLQLQRSLSNFQKYDFELHIDYFIRDYRIDDGKYARNLLLGGLLFTFIGLGLAFSEIDTTLNPEQLAELLSNKIIPSISLAFSSTIAALVTSLIVLILGNWTNHKVDTFQAKMSRFLIVDVHPYFEKAGQEAYFNRVEAMMDGVGASIRSVNANLEIVSNQSAQTLQDLAKGVREFSEVSSTYENTLNRTEQLLGKVYENSIRSEGVINNVNEVVKGMSSIFDSEELVLKDLADATREQHAAIGKMIVKASEISENAESRLEELKKMQIESAEKLRLSINEEIGRHVGQIGDNITSLSESLEQLPISIQNQIQTIVARVIENSEELNQFIKQLVSRFEESFDEASDRLGKASTEMQQFSEQVTGNMKTLINQIEENQRIANRSLDAIIQDYKRMIEAIASTNTRDSKAVWDNMTSLIDTQSRSMKELNDIIREKVLRLGEAVSDREGAFVKKADEIINAQGKLIDKINGHVRQISDGRKWWQFK